MSRFLSHVHEQLYTKMKYQDKVNDELLELLQQQDETILPLLEYKLPNGSLESLIDLENIHGWLQTHIELIEYRTNYILEKLKEKNLQDVAQKHMEKLGTQCMSEQPFSDCLQAFTYLQQYMLHGMPCDKGIALLEKSEVYLRFHCVKEVHPQINDFEFYSNLRLAWIQGVLSSSFISCGYDTKGMYHLKKKEATTCTIS